MKRRESILVCTLVLCLVSGAAYAQSSDQLNFDFYVGWQGGQKQSLSVASEGPYPGALFRSVELNVPNRGLWLGGSLNTMSCGDYQLYVQGWYFFPSNVQGTILLDPGATPQQIPADVKSHLDWWYVDVFGTRRIGCTFSALLGVRIDHHDYYTDDPEILNIIFPVTNRMRLDLNVLSTIPYIGVQWGPSYGLTLRAIYSPLGWINAKSTLSQNNGGLRDVNWLGGKTGLGNKQFFELFAEYTRDMGTGMELGIFARGTWLQATNHATLSESLVNGSADYDVSYHRAAWTLGANASVRFDMPQVLNW